MKLKPEGFQIIYTAPGAFLFILRMVMFNDEVPEAANIPVGEKFRKINDPGSDTGKTFQIG
jgi:hypothetical protein